MGIKVVSFDIFQTLVDVNQRIPQIWRGILGESYTEEMAQAGVKALFSALPGSLEKAVASERFYTVYEMYLECALSILESTGFTVSPETIVQNFFLQHSLSPLFDDVIPCMESLRGRYMIILSSDADRLMIEDLVKPLAYEHLFISEDLRGYKGSPNGVFFAEIIKQLGVKPEEIIHIGDSAHDVIGAHNAGIVSCWINREGKEWKHPIQPDYTIQSLLALKEILL